LMLTDSTISRNNVNAALFGDDVDSVDNEGGLLSLNNSTVTGNIGSGIGNHYGAMTVTNVTLSSNWVGLTNDYGTAELTNVTIDGNSRYGVYHGGSLYTETVTLVNTLIANSPTNCYVYAIPLNSLGYNLSSDGSCTAYFNQVGDLNNTDPQLGPLQNNGGPTLTQAPLLGSPAIDAIPFGANGCGTTITTDQRGVTRPIHGECDIGAYEVDYFDVFLPLIEK
jgi:hypothetical protein